MADFVIPAFLQNKSVTDIFNEMVEVLPDDIDTSQGSHAFNMTMPTALSVAQLCEFILPEVIKLIFPAFSYGEYLDFHAQTRGMKRREATAAAGEITVTGTPGTVIPKGSVLSTASVNDVPSVDYATIEAATIPAGGSVDITVECTQTGLIGNSPASTIIIAASRITGITSVTNPEPITGGTAEETDASLIERIDEYDKSRNNSFVGNVADYTRWAKSVPGVGNVNVIGARDDSGLVKIVITDANGEPATEVLCEEVYDYIMRPDNPLQRLAPINALLQVTAPETMPVKVQATVELTDGYTIANATTAFLDGIAAYLSEAIEDGEVKYTKIGAILSTLAAVSDYKDLLIGTPDEYGDTTYATDNLTIGADQLPTIIASDIDLTAGTV